VELEWPERGGGRRERLRCPYHGHPWARLGSHLDQAVPETDQELHRCLEVDDGGEEAGPESEEEEAGMVGSRVEIPFRFIDADHFERQFSDED
jgi:hypothetical protein